MVSDNAIIDFNERINQRFYRKELSLTKIYNNKKTLDLD